MEKYNEVIKLQTQVGGEGFCFNNGAFGDATRQEDLKLYVTSIAEKTLIQIRCCRLLSKAPNRIFGAKISSQYPGFPREINSVFAHGR